MSKHGQEYNEQTTERERLVEELVKKKAKWIYSLVGLKDVEDCLTGALTTAYEQGRKDQWAEDHLQEGEVTKN